MKNNNNSNQSAQTDAAVDLIRRRSLGFHSSEFRWLPISNGDLLLQSTSVIKFYQDPMSSFT